jgi:hypothetical protein
MFEIDNYFVASGTNGHSIKLAGGIEIEKKMLKIRLKLIIF